MKKKQFTEEEKEKLLNNPFVYSIGTVSVFYTNEFKEKALKEYQKGKSAKQIFIEAGFDLDIIGSKNTVHNLSEWRKNVNMGRKYKNKYAELKNALNKIIYLEAENAFLKKLEALENQFR